MKTLFELMLGVPTRTKTEPVAGVAGAGVGVGGLGGVGVGAGGAVVFLQTEGVPAQFHPLVILHSMHPAEKLAPVSHCSLPMMIPSPHLGPQIP